MATTPPLDSYDRQLLALVQDDCRLSQAELGARVHLSAAAVGTVTTSNMLADDGVIERFSAQVRPDALGYPLTIVVEVQVENERIDLLDAVTQSFLRCPFVQQCYYVAGECDFVLIFAVRDMDHYTALTRELFYDSHNVKRFKTLVTMGRLKTGMQVPVAES